VHGVELDLHIGKLVRSFEQKKEKTYIYGVLTVQGRLVKGTEQGEKMGTPVYILFHI
jgi:hypothetical protein